MLTDWEQYISIFFSSGSFHDVWQCSRRPYLLFLNVSSTKSWSLPVVPEKRNGFTDVFTSEWNHSQGLWKSSGRLFSPNFSVSLLECKLQLFKEWTMLPDEWMPIQWLKYLYCASWSCTVDIYYLLGRNFSTPLYILGPRIHTNVRL